MGCSANSSALGDMDKVVHSVYWQYYLSQIHSGSWSTCKTRKKPFKSMANGLLFFPVRQDAVYLLKVVPGHRVIQPSCFSSEETISSESVNESETG